MSDISRLMFLFPPLSLQNSRCAAPPGSIVGHASPGQLSQSTAASRSCSRCYCFLAFPFWQPGALGVRGIHNSTEYLRDAVVFVQHTWQPMQQLLHLQLWRDRDDLFFFDFVAKMLRRCVAKGHAIPQFFSPLPLLKLVDSISFSLCLLLYLCFTHPPFGLHFNFWPLR